MFSAIAMIAFVGSGMAGNTVVEVEKKAENVDCVKVAMVAYNAADTSGTWSIVKANKFYQGQYNACIKSTSQLVHSTN